VAVEHATTVLTMEIARLQLQKTAGGPERITVFDSLGIYKILATAGDTSAMERFVTEWLAPLGR
jgi:hypothetical protein